MVMNNGPQEEIIAVAKLAKRSLNLNGKKRPTMKQVAMELEWIRGSEESNAVQQSVDEDSDIDDMIEPWGIASCSNSRSITYDIALVDGVSNGETGNFSEEGAEKSGEKQCQGNVDIEK
ncbi:hypothetical protein CRYUN_Cryun36dG0026200 [Craigia yunnanensis]